MPKLQVPDQIDTGPAGTPIESQTSTAGVKIGDLQGQAAGALAENAKLGEYDSTVGADAVAKTGNIGKIMSAGAQQAAQTYSDIGNTAMNAGQALNKMGEQYFNQAESAIQDGIYNNAYAGASKEFNQRVQDRINHPYDDKGNPTFGNLVSDIGKIGDDVRSKYGMMLGNPEVANRFNTSMTEMSTSASILGMKQQRDQQMQFSQGAYTGSQTQLKQNILSAPQETVQSILAEGDRQTDAMVTSGMMTPEEGVVHKEALRHDAIMGRYSIAVQQDPVGATMALNNPKDPVYSMMNPTEKAQAIDESTKRLNELKTRNDQQAREQKANTVQNQTFNAQDLDLGIAQGTVTPADIRKSYDGGSISHGQYVNLTVKSLNASGQTAKITAQRNQISTAMTQGQILQGKFSNDQVNDHYNWAIKSVGTNPTLFDPKAPIDKARIAVAYKAPVTDFTNELKGTVAVGSPDQVLQAVHAWDFVQQKNPIAVSQLDSKTRAILYSVQSQITYGNVSPGTAIANARQSILQQDPSVQGQREKQFDAEDDFKPTNIQKTVNSMYSSSSIGSIFTGNPSGTLDPNDAAIVTGLLKQNYMLLGDAKQAEDLTKQQTKGIWGATSINPQTGSDKPVMFMPPEFSYPQYDFSVGGKPAMRINLEHDIAPYLTNGPMVPHQGDMQVKDISIEPNRYAPSRAIGETSYQVFGTINGQKLPVLDPKTGQPLTWTPDDGFIKNLKQQQYDEGVQSQVKSQQHSINTNTVGSDGIIPIPNGNATPVAHVDNDLRAQYGLPPLAPTQTNPDGSTTQGINNTTSMSLGVGTRAHVIQDALKYLGYSETVHNQVLGGMISKMTGSSTDPSNIPWCAGFVNSILKMNGMKGAANPMRAQDLLQVGSPTNNPQQGDIVVFDRGNGLGHAGFFMGRNSDGSINVLSGNQNNMVTVKAYGTQNVMGYRSLPNGDDAKALMTGDMTSTNQQQMNQSGPASTTVMNMSDASSQATSNNSSDVTMSGNVGGHPMIAPGTLAQMDNKALPVGIRQNNPGNITKNGTQWDGEVPNTQNRFKEFQSPEDGIAAIARNISQYNNKYQINTVNGIVHRYSATDQGEYAINMAKALGVDPNEHLDVSNPEVMTKIVKVIIKQENGYIPYDDRTILNGIMRNKYMPTKLTADANGKTTDPNDPLNYKAPPVTAPDKNPVKGSGYLVKNNNENGGVNIS